jgi:hypothetical protein
MSHPFVCATCVLHCGRAAARLGFRLCQYPSFRDGARAWSHRYTELGTFFFVNASLDFQAVLEMCQSRQLCRLGCASECLRAVQVLEVQKAGAAAALFYNSVDSRLIAMNASVLFSHPPPIIPSAFIGRRPGVACARAAYSGFDCDACLLEVRGRAGFRGQAISIATRPVFR